MALSSVATSLGDFCLAPPPDEFAHVFAHAVESPRRRVRAAKSAKSGLSEILIVTAFIALR